MSQADEPSQSLHERLERRAADSFLGRRSELTQLSLLLEDAGPVVFHVWGIPGIGKSTLVHMFLTRAREGGAAVCRLDCRSMEPTPRGFLGGLGAELGHKLKETSDAVGVIRERGTPFVLVLDCYESFQLMDTWLRQEFLPALPEGFRLILSGRQPPVPLWKTDPAWHGLFRVLPLEPLDQASAEALLQTAGVDGERARRLAAATHGNPLAIKLAAGAAGRFPSETDAGLPEVMQQLAGLFLSEVQDPETRRALLQASVGRRITRSLLRSLDITEETFETLRHLPFVDVLQDGLALHEAVREALARKLHSEHPERFTWCRQQAWRQLRAESLAAPRGELWRYTADMLYLVENPVVREAFFPSGSSGLAVEPARDGDMEAVSAIAARHDGPEGAEVIAAWWEHHPGCVRVVRDRTGEVVGFSCMAAAPLASGVTNEDPVASAWMRHLKGNPVPPGAQVLFIRRWLAAGDGEAPSAEQAACWLDTKRLYMEMRPALRRAYLTVRDLAPYAPAAVQLGFEPLEELTVDCAGAPHYTAMLDFGPASVDGWIGRLVGTELGVDESELLDRRRRALNLGGKEVTLTPLEFKLADYLQSQPGATVTREDLLQQVWGYGPDMGSSNVVDAVVKSLRRKLGPESERVQTVRGFGYRWRP